MSFFQMWVLVLALSAALCFFLKDNARLLARRWFLIALTLFVAQSLFMASGKQGHLARSEPALEIDSAELYLRLNTAMDLLHDKVQNSLESVAPGGNALAAKPLKSIDAADFHAEAIKVLDKALDKTPDSALLEAKLALVLADRGRKSDKRRLSLLLSQIRATRPSDQHLLGEALTAIYLKSDVEPSNRSAYGAILSSSFPPGWYRDQSLLRFYQVTQQSKLYDALKLETQDRSARLLINLLIVSVVAITAGLLGLLVIVVQLFTLPRKWGSPEDEKGGTEAVPWSPISVYGVLIGWLATQLVLSSFAQLVIRSQGLFTKGPLIAAATTALVYLLCNGPGLLYLYYFVCRPYKLNLFDAVRLRFKVGKLGPIRLILIGLCAWCAALPIVALVSYFAMKYWGAQGSSNPVLTLVLDAARSSDLRATSIFYLTLGVLAPLCEEALFRGFLYRSLRKYLGVGTSLLTSAALFAAVHLDSGAVFQLFCLGWVFGFVFERTKSLVPSMVAHGLWNSGTFTLVLILLGS